MVGELEELGDADAAPDSPDEAPDIPPPTFTMEVEAADE